MSLLGFAADLILGGSKKITSPTFVKEFTKENKQLNDLIDLSNRLKDGEKKDWIDRDIMFLKEGIEGENNVYFELKNSFLPILCLHDIRLVYDDYIAQFDFIVISNKFICVLETKKLNGNVIINRDGDFIRVFKNRFGKEIKREGMYSPVSQNDRHVRILQEVLIKEKFIKLMPVKSLVIMANPKTIVNKDKCPASISKSIYKYDQIVPFLKRLLTDQKNNVDMPEKTRYEIAEYLIQNNKPLEIDYSAKYGLTEDDFINSSIQAPTIIKKTQNDVVQFGVTKKEAEQLRTELKEFRLQKSREENIKPYFIFNNEQMEDLIHKYPRTEEELLNVSGFGKVKVEKYGSDILKLFI